MKPPIQYTKSGTINIAYQVFGTGPVDLVYIPGWVSNIDWMWACPELVYFFEKLSKVARVILFDKRGTGLSDRIVELSTLEERMEDIKAVMDATQSEKAILFGHSEGGSVATLFSATYPNRVKALIAFGIFAKRRYAPEYPWAPTDEERQQVYRMIENNWGSGQMNLESLAPSKAGDEQFMSWLASYFRSGASPIAAMKLTKMNTEVDITGILKYVKVPTLLMQRTGDIDVKIAEGKYIATRIENARFVEFQGDDHLFWAGNTDEVIEEMVSFICTITPDPAPKNSLITVLFGQVASRSKQFFKSGWLVAIIQEYGGRIDSINDHYFKATFKGPGKATACGKKLQKLFQCSRTEATLGVYMREGNLIGANPPNTIDHYYTKAINLQSQTNQIVVTQVIKQLLSGAMIEFTKVTSILDYHSNTLCDLYAVKVDVIHRKEHVVEHTVTKNETFLEKVQDIIQDNLSNSNFGVDMLTQCVGVSERQLQRKLKETTGKSPRELIIEARLSMAKKQLQYQNLPIGEIAFLCGFTSSSYFSKCFKKEFGVTPRALLIA